MQEVCSSNPPVVTGICDPINSGARHHRRINMCLWAVLKLVQVLFLNVFKVLESSGLFVCLGRLFSAWGTRNCWVVVCLDSYHLFISHCHRIKFKTRFKVLHWTWSCSFYSKVKLSSIFCKNCSTYSSVALAHF